MPSRRAILKTAFLAPVAAQLGCAARQDREGQAADTGKRERRNLYFTAAEYDFIEAALARIIPADDLGPGAKEAQVAVFIDRQLAGPYGRADTWYMQGPWREGTPGQGYQLKLTPAQLYRDAIRAIDEDVRRQHGGKAFAQLDAGAQDKALEAMEKGELKANGAPVTQFFDLLVQNTLEGFLADPMYGGNRDFIGWKLLGFPGPRYNYVAEIERYGTKYDAPFVSIAGADSGVRGS